MRFTLHAAAAAVLWFASLLSMLGWVAETCTGNAPDSLMAFVLVIPLNAVGIALLAARAHLVSVIVIAVLPLVVSFSYVGKAIQLLNGAPACNLVSGYGPWPLTGDETMFGTMWLVTACLLWIGIALAMVRGYRAQAHG